MMAKPTPSFGWSTIALNVGRVGRIMPLHHPVSPHLLSQNGQGLARPLAQKLD
jgi:hypothetical protein